MLLAAYLRLRETGHKSEGKRFDHVNRTTMNPFRNAVRRGALLRNLRAPSARALAPSQRLASTTTQPVEWEPKEVDPQLRDYPQLPAQSYQRRPAEKWDDPQERRNFGEPVSDTQS